MADSVAKPTVVGASGVEETSPDLLKNTPSNIARLEDVIEHCKGRQKYLAQTRVLQMGVMSAGTFARFLWLKMVCFC